MKIAKLFASICSVLIAIVLLIALLLPSGYSVERDIVLNKERSEVFSFIKHIKNQNDYSTWAKTDPKMKRTYQGVDGKIGFISAWHSENKLVGSGEQEIVNIIEGERLETELRFFEPFEAVDAVYMTTEALSANETKLTWGVKGEMSYPMNLFLLLMDMEKERGEPLAESLSELKKILVDAD